MSRVLENFTFIKRCVEDFTSNKKYMSIKNNCQLKLRLV